MYIAWASFRHVQCHLILIDSLAQLNVKDFHLTHCERWACQTLSFGGVHVILIFYFIFR